MWRRIASGSFAGLVWAAEQPNGGDVAAAQNILGVSLHAMQDFYSHSSWVDAEARRAKTFFEYPRAGRTGEALFTGAYEHDHNLGVKSHGKWIPNSTVYAAPGCARSWKSPANVVSPYANSEACEGYKAFKAGTSMQPTINGVQLPKSVMVYTPPESRSTTPGSPIPASNSAALRRKSPAPKPSRSAHDLAVRQSFQWCKLWKRAMNTAGPKYADFLE
jgi:hypothetical protein